MYETNRFDWMLKMKLMSEYYTNKGNKLKRKFFEDRDNGESDETLKEIQEQRKHLKKMVSII